MEQRSSTRYFQAKSTQASNAESQCSVNDSGGLDGSIIRNETRSFNNPIDSDPPAISSPNENVTSFSETSVTRALVDSFVCPFCENRISSLFPSFFHLLSKVRSSSGDVDIYLSWVESSGLKHANNLAAAFGWKVSDLRSLFDSSLDA